MTVKINGRDRQITRAEGIQRVMAKLVTMRVQELARDHHITELGRKVDLTMNHQWDQIYREDNPHLTIIAAAQSGKTLYNIIKMIAQASLGLAVGLVMPKDEKVTELVRGKLDPTIKNTPFYSALVAMSGGNDAVKYKTFGQYGRLHLVSCNSESELTSFTADCMHIDEYDFCDRNNLAMYPYRMNQSKYKLVDQICTPTVPGTVAKAGQSRVDNIHSEFLFGTQNRYHTTCPHCALRQVLDWYKNVIRAAHDESGRIITFDVRDKDYQPGTGTDLRVCCANSKCERPFDRTARGIWIPGRPHAARASYWVNPLASIVGGSLESYLNSFQISLGNPSKMQNFHNMGLAMVFAGGAAQFTEELFRKCTERGHYMLQSSDGPCTMGIDVNRPWFDVQISKWLRDRTQIKVHVAKVQGEEQLYALMQRFNVTKAVIDNDPEASVSARIQQKAWENLRIRVVRCRYSTHDMPELLTVSEPGENPVIDPPMLVTVNRTIAIDGVYETMQRQMVKWFESWRTELDEALYHEFTNPVRKLVQHEGMRPRYIWAGDPDHQLHASVYDWLTSEIPNLSIWHDLSNITPAVTEVTHSMPTNTGAWTDEPLVLI